MINLEIASRLENIKNIALFSELKNEQLFLILKNAKIINCKKDQNLFFEEEKAEKFYIILEGLMKLTKIDTDGNEAIIRITESGSLCDIFSDNFPYSAIAIKNTILLAISLKDFMDLAIKNNFLMRNILLEISQQNKALISQINSLKIGDGKEKIGQFLLETSIKEGKKNKNINLEFSKNEIASYLGMRLETFSRILHQLKNEGEILVKKNKIILTKEESLCSYCNNEISSKCDMSNSEFCNPRC